MLRITIVAVAALLAATQAAPTQDGGWNALLKADNLFHEEINTIQSKSNAKSVVLAELNELLGQENLLSTLYTKFLIAHEKEVADPEPRMKVFQENLVKIASHNLEANNGERTWFQGVTLFSDMTSQEFLDQYTVNFDLPLPDANTTFAHIAPTQADSKDWRGTAVSSVKNQAQCGSCATFACSAAIEGAQAIASKATVKNLSAQELLDCSTTDDVCKNGMDPQTVFKYAQNSGLATWESYPYTPAKGVKGSCKSRGKARAAKISKWSFVGQDEDSLRDAVATRPVAIAIYVNSAVQNYKEGIFSGDCEGNVNHAVTLVGYTSNSWIIKNSWSASWGDKGFIQIAKDGSNKCGVWTYPIIPTM